jgi:S-layer family protein
VQAEYWAFGYIKWSYCQGITSGYSDGTFRPEANTTRGQLAKMVVLAAGFPLVLPAGAPHFSDVAPGHPFYRYIEVAWSHTVITGYEDGTFRPASPVTRAQLAKMIVQARGLSLLDPPVARFRDVPREFWAYRYVEAAAAHQIVGGYGCGAPGETCPGFYYRPAVPATRAQLTKLLHQAFAVSSLDQPHP